MPFGAFLNNCLEEQDEDLLCTIPKMSMHGFPLDVSCFPGLDVLYQYPNIQETKYNLFRCMSLHG